MIAIKDNPSLVQAFNKVNRSSNKFPVRNRRRYNCWGFTAYCMGWYGFVDVLDEDEMGRFLGEKTCECPLTNLCIGDIIALYGSDCGGCCDRATCDGRNQCNELQHTMIYLGSGLYMHKPGTLELEISDAARVNELYGAEMGYYGVTKKVYRGIK